MSGSISSRPADADKIIKPKDLRIVWGKDKRYWRMNEDANGQEDSCYAELLQVCWLEVTGEAHGIQPNKKYSVGFNISFNEEMFGWDNCPVYLMAKVGKKEKSKWKKVVMDTSKKGTRFDIPLVEQFTVDTPATGFESSPGEDVISFGLYEIWNGKWKGGLKIHYAFVKEVGETK